MRFFEIACGMTDDLSACRQTMRDSGFYLSNLPRSLIEYLLLISKGLSIPLR